MNWCTKHWTALDSIQYLTALDTIWFLIDILFASEGKCSVFIKLDQMKLKWQVRHSNCTGAKSYKKTNTCCQIRTKQISHCIGLLDLSPWSCLHWSSRQDLVSDNGNLLLAFISRSQIQPTGYNHKLAQFSTVLPAEFCRRKKKRWKSLWSLPHEPKRFGGKGGGHLDKLAASRKELQSAVLAVTDQHIASEE